jgi:UDP-N-acetylglucosamine enolpyruvyl transferase
MVTSIVESIRVFPRGKGPEYIALSEAPLPSDQTDLNRQFLLLLKVGGGTIRVIHPDWLRERGGCP